MGKKQADPSLKGKKPINTAKDVVKAKPVLRKNPSHIANKMKRSEMYGKYLQQKKAARKEEKLKREKRAEELGEEVVKKEARTLENTRELEATMVMAEDPEVMTDEADDEFAPYFSQEEKPKILITTRPLPSQNLFYFIADLQKMVPHLHFYPRKKFSIKEICKFAANRDFTHLIVLSEKSKVCNGMTISHLRKHEDTTMAGPTAFFKVSNVITAKDIPHHGSQTSHIPELNLHGFGTRLGHRVGRLLGSLFPHDAQFQGRQVVTFHNQRDYIFVRQHRYIFDEMNEKQKAKMQEAKGTGPPVKTRLQELGPRFTLKLRWLQEGTFDTKHGEYEWIHKRKEMDTTRRKFHL